MASERAYTVTITHHVYATSARAAARKMRADLARGYSHHVYEVTDANTHATITRDLSGEAPSGTTDDGAHPHTQDDECLNAGGGLINSACPELTPR